MRPAAADAVSLGRGELVAAGRHFELIAAVLGEGALIAAGIERTLLAIPDHLDAGRVDALPFEVALGGSGATIAQRQVVFIGTQLVGLTTDPKLDARVGDEDGRL